MLFEQKTTKVHKSAVVDANGYRYEGDWLYNSIVPKSVQMCTGKMESGTGIFQKSTIVAIYSIREGSKRPDISSIFKALAKDNATNIDIHNVEKEVKNIVKNGKQENMPRVRLFFILDSL